MTNSTHLIDLGHVIGKLEIKEYAHSTDYQLRFVSPSAQVTEHDWAPATDICISGEAVLKLLRELNAHIVLEKL
jgi:hypothetical protein